MKVEEGPFTNEQIAHALELEEPEVRMLYKGKLYLTLEQLDALTAFLGEDLDTLLAGNDEYYEKKIVHCMKEFTNGDNREMILDFIDAYLDIPNFLGRGSL
jgi:plasmid maintenance system antidote protein VapI